MNCQRVLIVKLNDAELLAVVQMATYYGSLAAMNCILAMIAKEGESHAQ